MSTERGTPSKRFRDADDLSAADLESPVVDLSKFALLDVWRLVVVAWTFITSLLVQVVAKAVGLRQGRSWGHLLARALRNSLIRLGPTYVKLGQLIASSPGVFPKVLADEMHSLLEAVPPFSARQARHAIERDFGEAPEELFESFEDEPLASASVAQVHGCVLRDGRAAVVKILRPHLRREVDEDLRIMYHLARLIQRTKRGRTVNPVGLIEDLNRSLHQEQNLLLEAYHQHKFRENIWVFGDNKHVTVPEVYWPYCSKRVLCMERFHGKPIDRVTEADVPPGGEKLLLQRLLKVWFEATFIHGLFHGDVHAGNLHLLDGGQVCFNDFGVVGVIDQKMRNALAAMLEASALTEDWAAMVTAWEEADLLPQQLDPAQGASVVQGLFGSIINQDLEDVSFAQVLSNAVDMMSTLGKELDKNLLLCLKQLLYFERYGKEMAPHWKLAKDPFLLLNVFPDEVAEKVREEKLTLPS